MMPDETIHELMGLVRSLSGDINSQATKIIEIERKIDLVLAALGGAEGLMEHRLYHAKRKSSSAFWDEVWDYCEIHLLAEAGFCEHNHVHCSGSVADLRVLDMD
jgi:hypothetical protein